MAMMQYKVTVNSDGAGAATGYSQRIVGGRLHSIAYVKTDYADTVDFAITKESTGEGLWTEANVTAAKTVYPRAATNDAVAAAALYAAEGLAVRDSFGIAVDRVKIVLAQAGANKTGQFIVLVEQ